MNIDFRTIYQQAYECRSDETTLRRARYKFRAFDYRKVALAIFEEYCMESIARGVKELENEESVQANSVRVAKFLTNDTTKPSLMLAGGVGTGKTTMLTAVRRFLSGTPARSNIKCFRASELGDICVDHQEQFKRMMCEGSWCHYLMLDDVGLDPAEVKVYGNSCFPYVTLVESRYDKLLPMIITTNLSLDDFGQIYGERTADRMKEMFEIIGLNGESYRR